MLDQYLSKGLMSFVCITILAACTNSQPPPDESTEVLKTEGFKEVIHYPELELPLEVLTQAGAEFDETLLLDPGFIDDYLLSTEKTALNLGVYCSDALYLAVYHQSPLYMQRSSACERMSNALGIRDGFDAETVQRLDVNMGNSDSVIAIFKQSIRRAKYALEEDRQEDIASMIATGSFVEWLHLLCEVVKASPSAGGASTKNKDGGSTIEGIIRQREKVSALLERFSNMENTESVTWLKENMTNLEIALSVLEQKKDYTKASFTAVIQQVEKIRAYITQ